jgi:hypothetical protein
MSAVRGEVWSLNDVGEDLREYEFRGRGARG